MIVSDKRSYINPERQKELNKPNAVYIISCVNNEFYCENHPNGICQRGFFSLFMQVVYGIAFAGRHRLPFYVDFGNTVYPYTKKNPFYGEANFWNYYFNQKNIGPSQTKVFNLKYETYPLRVWSRHFISDLYHRGVNQLELSNSMKLEVQRVQQQFNSKKVLGVHIRMTDHYLEVTPAGIQAYLKAIDKHLRRFDQLFVATDDSDMLDILKERYPDKIVYHPYSRSSGSTPIHRQDVNSDGFVLGKEALLDCYSLASCQMTLLSPSNFSYAVLLLNPEMQYELVESWGAASQRRKTLAAYYLNEWGLRKW